MFVVTGKYQQLFSAGEDTTGEHKRIVLFECGHFFFSNPVDTEEPGLRQATRHTQVNNAPFKIVKKSLLKTFAC